MIDFSLTDSPTVSDTCIFHHILRLGQGDRATFTASAAFPLQPQTVVVTRPNAEYNVKLENLPAGTLRYENCRFEWTHAEFRAWQLESQNGLATGCIDPLGEVS